LPAVEVLFVDDWCPQLRPCHPDARATLWSAGRLHRAHPGICNRAPRWIPRRPPRVFGAMSAPRKGLTSERGRANCWRCSARRAVARQRPALLAGFDRRLGLALIDGQDVLPRAGNKRTGPWSSILQPFLPTMSARHRAFGLRMRGQSGSPRRGRAVELLEPGLAGACQEFRISCPSGNNSGSRCRGALSIRIAPFLLLFNLCPHWTPRSARFWTRSVSAPNLSSSSPTVFRHACP